MKSILKKNQLTILVLALMLVTAGYLNYNSNIQDSKEVASIGDATLVNSNSVIGENTVISNSNNIVTNSNNENNIEDENKTVTTNSSDSDFFTSSRLEREKMYSEMLDSYQKVLNGDNISDKQKEAAQKQITKITDTKNSIMICENLIKTKGFTECLVYVNDESISVVIDKEELKKEDTAQIQSIIAREMNAKLENIHIMNK